MAFDRPIEADRIDDFNLFSAFVRAPLWILGGVLGVGSRGNEDDVDGISPQIDDNCDDENEPVVGFRRALNTTKTDGCEHDTTTTDEHASRASSKAASKPMSPIYEGLPGMTASKNLSWSDQSGQSLVQYNDESVRHEPSPYSSVTSTTAPKPIKSVLRRSRSIRSQTLGDGTRDNTRYIPKMTTAQNGLIMPTRPFGPNSHGSGVHSPQLGYGFYTNLTPPTPEMYQNNSSKPSKTASFCSTASTTSSVPDRSQQNEVFRNLQNHNKGHMGWTSIPI